MLYRWALLLHRPLQVHRQLCAALPTIVGVQAVLRVGVRRAWHLRLAGPGRPEHNTRLPGVRQGLRGGQPHATCPSLPQLLPQCQLHVKLEYIHWCGGWPGEMGLHLSAAQLASNSPSPISLLTTALPHWPLRSVCANPAATANPHAGQLPAAWLGV